MDHTIFSKLKPIFAVSMNIDQLSFSEQIANHINPYVFLTKNNEISAYIDVRDLKISEKINKYLRIEQVLSEAVPIENIAEFKPGMTITLPFVYKVLGNPMVFVKNNEDEIIGYVTREDMLVGMFRKEKNINILKLLLGSIPKGVFVVDHDQKIINCNETGLRMIQSESSKVMGMDAGLIFNKQKLNKVFSTGATILNEIHFTNEMGVLVDYSPIESSDGTIEGAIIIVQDLPKVGEMAVEMEAVKDLNRDMNAILSTIYDELLVIDNKGRLIRHSENYIKDFWPGDLKDLIGENILELENKGFFSPSVIRLVLEKQEKVSIVQETKKGKKIVAVGNPIFNSSGDLQRIVVASRDITENTKLKSELEQTKEMTKKYEQELNRLRNKEDPSKDIIYGSLKMQKIVDQIDKIANFSSTVLILGESGVGKELIARAIHMKSPRSEKPFLTVNCGSIPENLLESELFGYTKGSFTGADAKGKKGYFEKADGGVLFLDEIGDMPVSLQVKLLRVLQESEVVPLGSVTPVPIDVQIIAATNKDLKQMVKTGTFREDLYYRINVIPIHVPPLGERPEDVPLLAYHTLEKLNKRYDKNYHLSPEALNLLESYSWPGNIRELQNLIERLFVTADEEGITAELVGHFLNDETDEKPQPLINGIIPLHQAKEEIEEQLILLAMKKYKTTTKAAEALAISQSAVSRKYNQILQKKK